MKKRYYNASTLRATIEKYEREYEMSSVELCRLHRTNDAAVRHIPGYQRSVWSSLWQELQDLEKIGRGNPRPSGDLHQPLNLA